MAGPRHPLATVTDVEASDWAQRIAEFITAGDPLGVAVDTHRTAIGIGEPNGERWAFQGGSPGDVADCLSMIESLAQPRWVWWDRAVPDLLAAQRVTVTKAWDIPTVHRLLHGGWRTSTPAIWAWLHHLDPNTIPQLGQLNLLSASDAAAARHEASPADGPLQDDGHLRPEWVAGGYSDSLDRLSTWASLALEVQRLQADLLAARGSRSLGTARSESAAEFLSAQLEAGGLPIDLDTVELIISTAAGPRPRSITDEDKARAERDAPVLDLVPRGVSVDLRNPNDVRAMLRHVAIDLPDTRAWRLEQHRHAHPIVDALLAWRKAERIATTYGWRWLDEHVSPTPTQGWGRLRGEWSSCDGAAGRMTATAGLHNLPAEMRPAVAAEPGCVIVRADLGQIEPRILAAVSGDPAFIAASAEDDLYAPVAQRLNVDRATAKVAVLGAMYGGTSGAQAGALRGLERSYPIAMKLLSDAAAQGEAGGDVFTVGGRRIRMWSGQDDATDDDRGRADLVDLRIDRARGQAAARGRYARNAIIQGAAAEFFKVWAILVRGRLQALDGEIVLCLHDELLIHVPADGGDATVDAVSDALAEAAYRWLPDNARTVRFVTDTSIVHRWSDAKA